MTNTLLSPPVWSMRVSEAGGAVMKLELIISPYCNESSANIQAGNVEQMVKVVVKSKPESTPDET